MTKGFFKKRIQKIFQRPKEAESSIYSSFMNFRIRISFFLLITSHMGIGITMGIEFIINSKYLLFCVAISYTGFLIFLFCVLKRKHAFLKGLILFSLSTRTFMRTFLAWFQNIINPERANPYLFLFQMMTTILLTQSTPSVFIHISVVLSEIIVMVFYALLYPEICPHSYFMYLYIVLLAFFSLNTIIMDKSIWKYFKKSWIANDQIESLKTFLDRNLLSSIVIFSLPENQQKSPVQNDLRIQFLNSRLRLLADYIQNDDESFPSPETTKNQGGAGSNEKDPPMSVEELGSFFIKKNSFGESLFEEIQKYGEMVQKSTLNLQKKGKKKKEEVVGVEPETVLCNLVKKSQISLGNPLSEGTKEKRNKLLYKAVLSPIVFNNKQSIILQLEDISYLKKLQKERKVSTIRERTIQYFVSVLFEMPVNRN